MVPPKQSASGGGGGGGGSGRNNNKKNDTNDGDGKRKNRRRISGIIGDGAATAGNAGSGGGNTNQNDFEEECYENVGTLIIDDIYMPPPPIHPTLSDDQTGTRLVIETIEIENFKSYGGQVTLGPFHKSFNSIVGPNGSGKSNVIDSMLFVFGYRAQKLRSDKISSFIHKSDQLECQHAKVTVNFAMLDDKGGDDHHIISGSHFSISRVVHKDNSSYYLIDERRSAFRDVSKKLQEFGIDLRYNRFLILQGEVEQISLMKPKGENPGDTGMLEYLEDIIGTSRYKEPIEQLHQKYSTLNEQRTMVMNRVNRSQKELRVVSEAKNEAVRALELENRKKIERSKIFQHQLHKLSTELVKAEAKYSDEQQRMDTLNAKAEELERNKTEFATQEQVKRKEANRLEKLKTEMKEKYKTISEKDYYLNQKKKTTLDKCKKLRKQLDEDRKKLAELESIRAETSDSTEVDKLEKRRIVVQTELANIEDEMKHANEEVIKESDDLIQKRNDLEQTSLRFTAENADLAREMNETRNQWTVLKDTVEQARAKYEQTRSRITKVRDETEEKSRLLSQYEQEIPKQMDILTQRNTELARLEQERTDLANTIGQNKATISELQQKIETNRSGTDTRNQIMSAVRAGHLTGILGRFGELAAIDTKYDVAISNACQLNGYICETMDQAAEALSYVKQHKLGFTTFVALDKLDRSTQEWNAGNRRFPLPRLIDLLTVQDERLYPAYYWLLRDTLVASDMDEATHVALEGRTRYRVVTLTGDVIETYGTMTKGDTRRRGQMSNCLPEHSAADMRASLSRNQQRITELQEQNEQCNTRREQIQYSIESIQREIATLEQDVKIMREKLDSYRADVEENRNRLAQYESMLPAQKTELDRCEANPDIVKAEQRYETKRAEYEKEQEKLNKISDELIQLNDALDTRLREAQEPIKERKKVLEKEQRKLQEKLNTFMTKRKSFELDYDRLQEVVRTSENKRTKMEEEIEQIKSQIEQIEKEAIECNEAYEKATDDFAMIVEEVNEIECKLKQADEELKRIKSKKIDLDHELEKKMKSFRECKHKHDVVRAELDAIQLDRIDDLDSDDDDNDDDGTEEEAEEEADDEEVENGEDEADDEEEEEEDEEEQEVKEEMVGGEEVKIDGDGDALEADDTIVDGEQDDEDEEQQQNELVNGDVEEEDGDDDDEEEEEYEEEIEVEEEIEIDDDDEANNDVMVGDDTDDEEEEEEEENDNDDEVESEADSMDVDGEEDDYDVDVGEEVEDLDKTDVQSQGDVGDEVTGGSGDGEEDHQSSSNMINTTTDDYDGMATKKLNKKKKKNKSKKNVTKSKGSKTKKLIKVTKKVMVKRKRKKKKNLSKSSDPTTTTTTKTKKSKNKTKKKKVSSTTSSSKKSKKQKSQTIPQLTETELRSLSIDTIEHEIERIDTELKRLSPNYAAIEQYRTKRLEHRSIMTELTDITTKRDTYMDHLTRTKAMRQSEFKHGFVAIARKLKELYRTITLGGDADLEFIDSLDPFSEGINFAVRPNKKCWKNNINLSGGEKTLASLALIFALHHYKPSPLYIMDEIDAALDFKNVSIIANYIQNRTRNTQFLIISLRNNMYELAERLIGIYKIHNISRTVAFDPRQFEQKLEKRRFGGGATDSGSSQPSSQLSNHHQLSSQISSN